MEAWRVQDQPRMTVADCGMLSLLSFLWGGSFFFVIIIVKEIPPLTLVFTRFTIASAALWIYLRASRLPVPGSLSGWAAFAGMGALNNLIPATLIAWGEVTITSGLASILIATTPIFSILAAHYWTTDEKMSPNKVIGVVLGVTGVVILVGADSLNGSQRSIFAILGCLAAALSYGFANVFGRRFKRMGIAPAVGAFGQITATAAMMLPMALTFDAPWRLPIPSVEVWVSMGGLALVSTALAYVIFFRILASAGGTNISLVTLLIPVSTILLGSLILGERLLAVQFAGMALIGLGLIAIDGRLWSAVRLVGAPPGTR
jgi:drug/metabolite transporter (DMT)-like permease